VAGVCFAVTSSLPTKVEVNENIDGCGKHEHGSPPEEKNSYSKVLALRE